MFNKPFEFSVLSGYFEFPGQAERILFVGDLAASGINLAFEGNERKGLLSGHFLGLGVHVVDHDPVHLVTIEGCLFWLLARLN